MDLQEINSMVKRMLKADLKGTFESISEMVVEQPAEEGSLLENFAIGLLATATLGGLAIAAFATGGAVLVFAGVCLVGTTVGTGVNTLAA